MQDIEILRLKITDYSQNADLYDAINRYHTLLQMSFETNIYKVYETASSQIYRMWQSAIVGTPSSTIIPVEPNLFVLNFICEKCKTTQVIQVNFGQNIPRTTDAIPFPNNNIFKCKNCSMESNLLGLRQQIEAQTGKKIIGGEQL